MRFLTKEEIGKILKNLRMNVGLTQKEVAEAIGRTQQVIGHWETGYSQPDANTLFVLCDLYNANIDDAFGFTTKNTELDKHERAVIEAYRNNPSMQVAVDRLLNVAENEAVRNVNYYRAARSKTGAEHQIIQDDKETLERLRGMKDKRITRKEDL